MIILISGRRITFETIICNQTTVSYAQVSAACGQPSASRDRRRSNRDASRRSQQPGGASHHQRQYAPARRHTPTPTVTSVSVLERIVRESRARIEATRDLWRRMPESICDNLAAATSTSRSLPADSNGRCWNGRTLVPVGYVKSQ